MNERHDDLQEIIDAALREMAAEEGDGFDPQACNLAEFCVSATVKTTNFAIAL